MPLKLIFCEILYSDAAVVTHGKVNAEKDTLNPLLKIVGKKSNENTNNSCDNIIKLTKYVVE